MRRPPGQRQAGKHLGGAPGAGACAGLLQPGWARQFYDAQRGRGKTHHAALRALGNRWLEILWHCLIRDVPYNESVHVANRNRALGRINQPTKRAA